MRPQLPDYGVFLFWPDAGRTLIHPDDMAVALPLIPSNRVFRRFHYDGVFYHYSYGARWSFRVRPCMWVRVQWEGLDLGDQVEVSGLGLSRESFVAKIDEMRFQRRSNRIEYRLQHSGLKQARTYLAEELIKLEREWLGEHRPRRPREKR